MRCFTALLFDDEIIDAAVSVGTLVRADLQELLLPEPRWEQRKNIHCTVNFFGSVSPVAVGRLIERTRTQLHTVPGYLELSIGPLGVFPSTHRPEVLWLGCTDATGILQRTQEIGAEIAREEGLEVERRNFMPHITLGRWKIERFPPAMDESLNTILRERSIALHPTITSLSFMESITRSEGSEYRVIEIVALVGG
jgi:2'-5' RNA ligase